MNKEMYRKAVEAMLSTKDGELKGLEKLNQKELKTLTDKLVALGDKA